MKSVAYPAISLALVLFFALEISSSEPVDRVNTTTTPSDTNATSTVAAIVSVTAANLTTAATANVTATTAAPVVSSTQNVAMVMEGNGSPPKKSELRKDSTEPKKKVEPEKQHEEKSDVADSYPVKEITKPSVVKPRKGVEDLKIEPNAHCLNVSDDQMEKCLKGVTQETQSTTSTTEAPPTVSPHSKSYHPKPNVTLDAPDQQTPAKREDYIIPVVGIIFVIPLIVILGALVYKKGVDLWERRHYRPMDFLIDGIYNNQ